MRLLIALPACRRAEAGTLQTAPGAGFSETNGRASLFLVRVFSALIALAFIGQVSRLGTAFYTFGPVVLPTLAFLGVTTFERAIKSGVEDAEYARRIKPKSATFGPTAALAAR